MPDSEQMYAVYLRYNHADHVISFHRTLEGAVKRRDSLRENLKSMAGFNEVYAVTVTLED